ncbi:hypothetical protein O6H91_02G140000 [Diphasiastrum complanatum]|uniref:Uncharacterized protein n=1 Tax=Diphasiastrum complanatum TaxID=34168 RepID=A0ACC2ELE6_DIPCM|nr:hypothetical protein O6H91_02G140000 [Diphasiastrum complanatum]
MFRDRGEAREFHPVARRWSSPTDRIRTQMRDLCSGQESRFIGGTHQSAGSLFSFPLGTTFSSFNYRRLSRNFSSYSHGKTASGVSNASDTGSSSQDSARVRTTGEEPYSPHLRSDIGTAKLPLSPLVIALAVPLVAGVIDGVLNNTSKPWYRNLDKPAWTPPDWVLVMVWGLLYAAMGFASWLVWTQGGWAKQAYPLTTYAVQLILNLLWVAAFLGAENLALALFDMVLLIIAIAASIAAFQPVNPIAADLMKVYLVWVFFAAILNYTLWIRNPSGPSDTTPSVRK